MSADLIVKVDWDRKGLCTLGKAGELCVKASGLMFDGHHQPVPPDAMPRRFLLEHTCKLDKPKGKSTTAVLKGISDDLEAFYGNVDWRTSVLGNGLYGDPRSIVLIAINLAMVLAFASVLVRGRAAAKER